MTSLQQDDPFADQPAHPFDEDDAHRVDEEEPTHPVDQDESATELDQDQSPHAVEETDGEPATGFDQDQHPAVETADEPDESEPAHPIAEAEPAHAVGDEFREFWERLGAEILGAPITEVREEHGVTVQYFERAALELPDAGEVRLKALGREVLRLREATHQPRPMVVRPPIIDAVYDLPRREDRRYETRPLAQIRQLIIHHTAADPSLGIEVIAQKHVETLGWPAIGYHFVIERDGRIYETNDLTTVSFHARQANASTLGIAFCGNFDTAVPAEAQLESGGALCAYLLRELSLPIENVRGHRAVVSTACPGHNWAKGTVWRDQLLEQIRIAMRTT